MQLRQIQYILPIQRIVCAFFVVIASLAFNGCNQTDHCSNEARCEMLDNIEGQMFQRPESLDSLLGKVDTTNMTPHEQARVGTIRGIIHFENGKFDKSTKELEKAEIYFFNQQDHYHLHICKLIKAFIFEFLNLDHNAAGLFVECEDYFKAHQLDKFKFYATLGLFRMAKPLNLDEKKILARLHKASVQFDDPNYFGLLNSTIGGTEKNDSLSNIFYERAKLYFIRANRWSRVYAIDLNALFMKIKKDPSERTQLYYDNFNKREYLSTPTVRQTLRYKFAQAYLYAHMGKNEQSIEVAQQVLSEAIAYRIAKVEWDCVELLSSLYKRTGDFANAHAMIERHNAMKETQQKALQQIRLLALGAHYKYSEQEREKLELKLRVQKYLQIFVAISLIFMILISIGWVSLKKSRYKQEILKLKNVEIEDQISNLIGSLDAQKNKNEKLIRQAEEISHQYKDSLKISAFLQAIDQNEIKTWMEFESLFHDLRPGWIEKLKQAVPELTATDLKYCMCLYFNLSNYTIAKLCDTGVEAIKGAKKRIRNKFALNDAKEIYLFLRSIE